MRTALTIAGSDSSGGAGIQADIKTMSMNGVYAMSAITALTAQNTMGVTGIMEVSPEFLREQIDDVFEDIRPDAVKIGMVSSSALIHVIAKRLKAHHAKNIVVDPVMVATSGSRLISEEAVETLKSDLLPIADILTPNIPEAEILSGMSIQGKEDMIRAAELINRTYGCAVLCKGGHSLNDANDLLYADGSFQWFCGRRIENPNTHGTGCTLSSAIASNLAKGFDMAESVRRSKEYLSCALEAMLDLGKGSGPMNHAFDLQGKFSMSCQEESLAFGIETPLVTIIVPVYNAQQTIRRCVDSILRQNYRNFELILVDDGSQDASGSICDEYAVGDSRVRVIHKPNTGVSDSRNIAIGKAGGTYLQFVDSDDWIAPETTGSLVLAAQSNPCDLVVSDFYRVIEERIAHKGSIQENGLITREEYATHMMERPADFYYGVLWNKLYRKSLIDQFHIEMDTEISWCEDFMFNLEYLCHAGDIYVLRVPLYYYVKTRTSLTNHGITLSKTIKMKAMVFEYYKRFYMEVFDEKDYEKSRLQVYRFLLDAANDGIVPPAILPGSIRLGEERTRINPEICENDSALLNLYLKRKCLELCFQPLIFGYDLSVEELYLMLFLCQNHGKYTKKELAEFVGQPRRKLDSVLQKLRARGYISWTEQSAVSARGKSRERRLDIQILPDAEPVFNELKTVWENYQQMVFSKFTDREIVLYEELSKRVKDTMVQMLS